MKSSLVLAHEEFRPPRLLTWPLVFLGAGIVGSAVVRELHWTEQTVFFIVLGAALCAVLLLEFVAVVIEVRETEIRFSVAPLYRRTIIIANIEHSTVKTYHSPGSPSARSWRPPKHCLELTMKDGTIFTITSTNPEQLLTAIETAKGMAVGE